MLYLKYKSPFRNSQKCAKIEDTVHLKGYTSWIALVGSGVPFVNMIPNVFPSGTEEFVKILDA